MDRKFKKNLNIRPPKTIEGGIEKLEFLAKLEGRTLNNYVWRILEKHINKYDIRIK